MNNITLENADKIIIQKGTGYCVGFIKNDEVIINLKDFISDDILEAIIMSDDGKMG